MTDWMRILTAADSGAEHADTKLTNATTMQDRRLWHRRKARLDDLAELALLSIVYTNEQ